MLDNEQFQEEMKNIYADLKAQDDRVQATVRKNTILLAVEYGFRCREKGLTLNAAIEKALKELI